MNKKGQTLVIFVVMLPIIVIVIQMIINKNNMYYDQNNMKNITQEAIYYGLNNITNENVTNEIEQFINKNIECESIIEIENDTIKITLKKENNTIKKILGTGNIKVSYIGYIENGKKKVEVAYDS